MNEINSGRHEEDTEQHRLMAEVDSRFERGRFVAVEKGSVIADAAKFDELVTLLKSQGVDARAVLIVRAGEETSAEACILLDAEQA